MGVQQTLLGGGRALPGTQTFTAPGTALFTVPAGYTTLNVTTVGGGGGGGGHKDGGDGHQGGIGGSGGYSTQTISVTPGQVLSVVVGSGGASGSYDGIFNPLNSNRYTGGRGGTSRITGFETTIATGGWGGGMSGGGGHGDKGTIEDWANNTGQGDNNGEFPFHAPWLTFGNGRAGLPNGQDGCITNVNQSRNVGRSNGQVINGYTITGSVQTGYAVTGAAGAGGEGRSGENSVPSLPPQNGTNGMVIVRWGQAIATTNFNPFYRGNIYIPFDSAVGGAPYGLVSLDSAGAGVATATIPLEVNAFGGWEESYISRATAVRTTVVWNVSVSAGGGVTVSTTGMTTARPDITIANLPDGTHTLHTSCVLTEHPVGSHASGPVVTAIFRDFAIVVADLTPPPPAN
jgi:hypothetical protein